MKVINYKGYKLYLREAKILTFPKGLLRLVPSPIACGPYPEKHQILPFSLDPNIQVCQFWS